MASAQRPLAGDVGPASLGDPHRRDSGHRRCRDLLPPRVRYRHRGHHLGRSAPDVGRTGGRCGVSLASTGPGADPRPRCCSAAPDDRGPLPSRRYRSAVVACHRSPAGVRRRSRPARLAHSSTRPALIEQPHQLRIHLDVALQAAKKRALVLRPAVIVRGLVHGSTVRGQAGGQHRDGAPTDPGTGARCSDRGQPSADPARLDQRRPAHVAGDLEHPYNLPYNCR